MFIFLSPAEVNGETDIAFVVLTSGSTAKPKGTNFLFILPKNKIKKVISVPCLGVCISHASILDKIPRLAQYVKSTDTILGFTSLSAICGVRLLMSSILMGAIKIVNHGEFSASRFIDIVERFQVTYTSAAPSRLVQLLDHPSIESANLSSIKFFTSGGAKLTFDQIQRMDDYLTNGKLCYGCGITETIGRIAVNLYHSENDCVGQLVSGCEAKIINDDGDRMGINEHGELCIKQLYNFLGYLGDSDATSNCIDDEGFFRTGDIARFDENGDLFIVDRKKQRFKSCGNLVSPIEIEEFLNKIDGVKLSCLVPIPDPSGDFLSAAVIVKTVNSTCTEEGIYNAVSRMI